MTVSMTAMKQTNLTPRLMSLFLAACSTAMFSLFWARYSCCIPFVNNGGGGTNSVHGTPAGAGRAAALSIVSRRLYCENTVRDCRPGVAKDSVRAAGGMRTGAVFRDAAAVAAAVTAACALAAAVAAAVVAAAAVAVAAAAVADVADDAADAAADVAADRSVAVLAADAAGAAAVADAAAVVTAAPFAGAPAPP